MATPALLVPQLSQSPLLPGPGTTTTVTSTTSDQQPAGGGGGSATAPPADHHQPGAAPNRRGGTTDDRSHQPEEKVVEDGAVLDPEKQQQQPRRYRLLARDEWARFCRGVGVFGDDEGSEEVTRPTCALWPAKGFRDGLYQDVLIEQTKFAYLYYALSIFKWALLFLQIALGSILTALGSFASHQGITITVIAAINTGIAGVLALLHNSGAPERFRSDRNEYKKVEEHIKAIVDTALIPDGDSINEVLAGCFERYRAARQSVENNLPAFYTPATPTGMSPRGSYLSSLYKS